MKVPRSTGLVGLAVAIAGAWHHSIVVVVLGAVVMVAIGTVIQAQWSKATPRYWSSTAALETIGPHVFLPGELTCERCGASKSAAALDAAGRPTQGGGTYAAHPDCL